ncbi:MAG: site-specific integrase [Acidiferrobacter sp.]
MAPLARLALETAMRQGELLALRWERVDLARRTAHLPETKNGTPRTVPLSPAALLMLKAMPRDLSGRVFPLSQSAVAQAWERATQHAGIKGLRFHDLRHEATSRLFEKGLNLMEVAAITGHKTLQILKRYTHLRAEDLAARL